VFTQSSMDITALDFHTQPIEDAQIDTQRELNACEQELRDLLAEAQNIRKHRNESSEAFAKRVKEGRKLAGVISADLAHIGALYVLGASGVGIATAAATHAIKHGRPVVERRFAGTNPYVNLNKCSAKVKLIRDKVEALKTPTWGEYFFGRNASAPRRTKSSAASKKQRNPTTRRVTRAAAGKNKKKSKSKKR
jgi:hypothetical protein